MKRRAHAKKVDANQAGIVDALRKSGAIVYLIEEPVDLLVGYKGNNYLLEVKNLEGKNYITNKQSEFMQAWQGTYSIVYTIKDAFDAISIA